MTKKSTTRRDEPKKRGRPSKFSQVIADEICERIAGGESLRAICEDVAVPSREAVRHWLQTKEGFLGQYARAREWQADLFADEIIEIADTEPNPHKARVRIDARKWIAARLRPKVYGDKVQQDHTGDKSFTIVTGVPRTQSDTLEWVEDCLARSKQDGE